MAYIKKKMKKWKRNRGEKGIKGDNFNSLLVEFPHLPERVVLKLNDEVDVPAAWDGPLSYTAQELQVLLQAGVNAHQWSLAHQAKKMFEGRIKSS